MIINQKFGNMGLPFLSKPFSIATTDLEHVSVAKIGKIMQKFGFNPFRVVLKRHS